MQKAPSYQLLAIELKRWSELSLEALVASVGSATRTRTVQVDGESITIEASAKWLDAKQRAIRVTAVAYGPSTSRLERIEEGVTLAVVPSTTTAGSVSARGA